VNLVTKGGVKSVAVLRKLEPEKAKKVIDEKAQEVDARRGKKRKDSAASSNSEPNVKIRLKLVAGPIKAYNIVKDRAAAPRMCIICCRFFFLSLVMWFFRVEAAKGTLIILFMLLFICIVPPMPAKPTFYSAPWVPLTINPFKEKRQSKKLWPKLTPFLPPNFDDTNVHAGVTKLAVGDYLCKI